mmetsp:Transcript_21923/g.85912  ORF Transcript_21923/g.85912 Transcript_21923/m.85912 type:complete len:219 (+) Transcript_21923:1039-1695(+)
MPGRHPLLPLSAFPGLMSGTGSAEGTLRSSRRRWEWARRNSTKRSGSTERKSCSACFTLPRSRYSRPLTKRFLRVIDPWPLPGRAAAEAAPPTPPTPPTKLCLRRPAATSATATRLPERVLRSACSASKPGGGVSLERSDSERCALSAAARSSAFTAAQFSRSCRATAWSYCWRYESRITVASFVRASRWYSRRISLLSAGVSSSRPCLSNSNSTRSK